jgi:hypothetical protein
MNITEQIGIMKFEARLANRAKGEGLRNWNAASRAASLAVRQAAGSVWGWNKRARATAPSSTSAGYDSSMAALNEDAAAVRRSLAIQASGGKVLSARPAAYDEIAEQRLESFKAWLAEVKRTETAIDDFNGIVAAAGGLAGVTGAKRGQSIGSVTADAAAEAAAKKVAFEKSIRRKFEKNNADYLRKNPDERSTMLDMVAEKAEYYSASPAQKVEMEKDAYRQIRDRGTTTMREKPATKGADYRTLLEAKRSYVREREAIRPQLQADEVAYPVGNGVWVGRLPNGDERLISVQPDGGPLYNRKHSAACASSTGQECNCSCGGSQHGGGLDTGGGDTADNVSDQANESHQKNGVKGMTEEERLSLIDELERKLAEGKQPDGDAEEEMLADLKKASAEWTKKLDGFRKLIEQRSKPSMKNLAAQLAKDKDEAKYKMAVDALSEAYHTKSLDLFQNEFKRDPKNNEEFRTFQKKNGIPPEFIGE